MINITKSLLKSIKIIPIIILIVCSNVFAQRIPTIIITDDTLRIPLKLSELKIEVKVTSNIATTTMTMKFYNGMNRVLEGDLFFPLSEEQTVSHFAMDINGKMRDAVIVEKNKGREVFETEVRKKIDPGLLELTKGNVFQSRIYPIPAKGYKTIVITYDQELKDDGNAFYYYLPLQFKDTLDLFTLKAEVFKQDIEPKLSNNGISDFQFKKWNESYLAEFEKKHYIADKPLSFYLPKEADRQTIFIEPDSYEVNKNYFYLTVSPKIFTETKAFPKRICLFWDVSNSMQCRDIEKEFSLLDHYIKKIKNLNIDLITFSNDVNTPKDFFIFGGRWEELKDYLKNLKYDGGTQLGAIDLHNYKCDEFILSSDGMSDFGKSEIVLSGVPIIVISSCPNANFTYLKYLVLASSGTYFNITELSDKQIQESLNSKPYTFISAEYDTSSIIQTYPSIPTVVNNSFTLTGIMLKNEAKIKLNFGFGNEIKQTISVSLNLKDQKSESGLIKHIWAAKKINELDMMFDKNKDEITKTGQDNSIVTRNTSLIILDRVEDYVKYHIVPPDELKEKYEELTWKEKEAEKKIETDHIEEVVAMFAKRIDWWNKEFKFSTGKPPKEDTTSQENNQRNGHNERAERPAPSSGSGGGESMMQANEMPLTPATKKDMSNGDQTQASIVLKKWDPQTPYLDSMKAVSEDKRYDTYLNLKKSYANSSAFYLDMADVFIEQKEPDIALRILSNIAEMQIDNPPLLRILAYRLQQLNYNKYALLIFREVLKLRPEEPQSYRDLALALALDNKYQEAVDLLYHIVKNKWDSRFPEIELIALSDMNNIIAICPKKLNLESMDTRLIKNLPVDMRIVLTWDADNTDIDLWVTDPNGEKCFYSHPDTQIGGHLSKDFTRGYGPEEFLLKKAQPGDYKVEANYYGNTQQVLAGATTIQLLLTTSFGTPDQKTEAVTLRLKDKKEVVEVGKFLFTKISR